MPRRAMPPERQVQHQTATQPVREAWLQTVTQELAKPQRRVSLPEQQHQTETQEPVTRLQTAIRRAQVSKPRKERQRQKAKPGPAQPSEPQRPRTATEQAQQQVLPRQKETQMVQQLRKAMRVRQPQTVKQPPEAAEVLPRQTENLPQRPEPRCRRARLVLRAVSRPQKGMPCCLPSPPEASEPEWLRRRDSSGRRTLAGWAWKQPLHHPRPDLRQRTAMPARPANAFQRSARTLSPSAEAPLADLAAKQALGKVPGRHDKFQTPAPPAFRCAAPLRARSAEG